MSTVQQEIHEHISKFVTELDALVRKSTLEALKEALGATGTITPVPRRGRPARATKATGARRGRKPAANVEAASEAILAHVKANDGKGVSEIAAATRTPLPVAKKALSSLLSAGAVKKTGQKRGTKYHVGSGRKPRGAKKATAKKTKRGGRRKARKAA
jgi:hypothetical protein